VLSVTSVQALNTTGFVFAGMSGVLCWIGKIVNPDEASCWFVTLFTSYERMSFSISELSLSLSLLFADRVADQASLFYYTSEHTTGKDRDLLRLSSQVYRLLSQFRCHVDYSFAGRKRSVIV
jgi:hypothetical protein